MNYWSLTKIQIKTLALIILRYHKSDEIIFYDAKTEKQNRVKINTLCNVWSLTFTVLMFWLQFILQSRSHEMLHHSLDLKLAEYYSGR